jgi:hypothetical protein
MSSPNSILIIPFTNIPPCRQNESSLMKSLQASNGINNGSDGQEHAKEGGVGV